MIKYVISKTLIGSDIYWLIRTKKGELIDRFIKEEDAKASLIKLNSKPEKVKEFIPEEVPIKKRKGRK